MFKCQGHVIFASLIIGILGKGQAWIYRMSPVIPLWAFDAISSSCCVFPYISYGQVHVYLASPSIKSFLRNWKEWLENYNCVCVSIRHACYLKYWTMDLKTGTSRQTLLGLLVFTTTRIDGLILKYIKWFSSLKPDVKPRKSRRLWPHQWHQIRLRHMDMWS